MLRRLLGSRLRGNKLRIHERVLSTYLRETDHAILSNGHNQHPSARLRSLSSVRIIILRRAGMHTAQDDDLAVLLRWTDRPHGDRDRLCLSDRLRNYHAGCVSALCDLGS